MATHPLRQYAPEVHPALRSALLLATPLPEVAPSVDELEAAQTELRHLKQQALERAKKAAGDLKIIENEMKKMREMEKGKARALPAAVQKVKREPSCMYLFYFLSHLKGWFLWKRFADYVWFGWFIYMLWWVV